MATTTCGITSQIECRHASWTSLGRAPAGLCQMSTSWAARAGGRQKAIRHRASLCFDKALSRQIRRRRQLRVSALFKEPDPDQKGSPLEGELAGIIFKVGILCTLAAGLAMPALLTVPAYQLHCVLQAKSECLLKHLLNTCRLPQYW